jgi:hypothetical protein
VSLAGQHDHRHDARQDVGERREPLAQVGGAAVPAQQTRGHVDLGVAIEPHTECLHRLVVHDLCRRVRPHPTPDRRHEPGDRDLPSGYANDVPQMDRHGATRTPGGQSRPGRAECRSTEGFRHRDRWLVQQHAGECRRRGPRALQCDHRARRVAHDDQRGAHDGAHRQHILNFGRHRVPAGRWAAGGVQPALDPHHPEPLRQPGRDVLPRGGVARSAMDYQQPRTPALGDGHHAHAVGRSRVDLVSTHPTTVSHAAAPPWRPDDPPG